jgi:CheY-like chemotaxis protein
MATSALADVHDVISWLQQIEELVGSLYARAAKACCDDTAFSSFLSQLAKDEQSHSQFMSEILSYLAEVRVRIVLDIALDSRTRDRVETPLKRFQDHLAGESISKRCVIEYMARAESSELNPVFLYIVRKFSGLSRESERMTAEIQSHLLRIQDFIDSLDKDLKPSLDVETLPAVWENRFLVVDDHEPLRKLVASLLSRRGSVETVAGGSEGLDKVREHFYNGIVSDIEMPGLDGFEFYGRAVEYDSKLKDHFLFYSAYITPEREAYLTKNRLRFLQKPFGLSEFSEIMDRILRQ